MSDVTREFRVVDRLGYPYTGPLEFFEAREAMLDLEEHYPKDGPFRMESRTVTDWLETEQPADSATGCATTEASAP